MLIGRSGWTMNGRLRQQQAPMLQAQRHMLRAELPKEQSCAAQSVRTQYEPRSQWRLQPTPPSATLARESPVERTRCQ